MKIFSPSPRIYDLMTWKLCFHEMPPLVHPEALTDVKPLLERLDRAFGSIPLAQLLGVNPSDVVTWMHGQPIDANIVRRILDLHDVLMRALRVFSPDAAMRWLVGNEPFLGGNRPIDVLALYGAGRLIQAIDNIDAGAYT